MGSVIYKALASRLGLTPKERFYSLLAVGSLAAWFGFIGAAWLGIPGAAESQLFGVEPLLVIGLMIGESQKHGIPKLFAGTGIVTGLTFAAGALLEANPSGGLWILLVFLTPSLVMMIFAARGLRRNWAAAIAGGDIWRAPLPPGTIQGEAQESQK
jgi:uncharacterized membrane protein (UPF0136 family)